MCADIAVVCEPLAVAVVLSRPPPARGKARMRGVGEIDDACPHAEVAHMADVEDVAIPHDLHPIAPAIEVAVPDHLEAVLLRRAGMSGRRHRRRLWPV